VKIPANNPNTDVVTIPGGMTSQLKVVDVVVKTIMRLTTLPVWGIADIWKHKKTI
jgi:hypothetical protein